MQNTRVFDENSGNVNFQYDPFDSSDEISRIEMYNYTFVFRIFGLLINNRSPLYNLKEIVKHSNYTYIYIYMRLFFSFLVRERLRLRVCIRCNIVSNGLRCAYNYLPRFLTRAPILTRASKQGAILRLRGPVTFSPFFFLFSIFPSRVAPRRRRRRPRQRRARI